MMGFIAELRRRNVLRMAGLYLVGAWLITQVASTLLPLFDAPTWVTRSVVILLAIGFVPALVFSWIYELTPQGLKRDANVAPEQSIGRETGRRIDRAIIAVLLAALGYFAVDKFVLAPRHETAPAPAAATANPAAAQPSAAGDKSIAVLPLANEGGNADEQYFSDGLSEDLITALSQFAGLKVIGRNSSFQFRNSTDDSRTIGGKLGVAHLLEGSVRRAGDVVRITAELINANDGSTQWSQRYDRPYQDLFKLQDDITGAVAAELKAKLLTPSGTVVQSDRPPSGSLEAYNALLQGNFQSARDTEAGYRAAVLQYSEAARLDPRYASAWAALSMAESRLAGAFLIDVPEQQKTFAHARDAATKALALEPDNASAHRALGALHLTADLDWVNAEVDYRRAVELAPGNAPAKFAYGRILATLGRLDEAVAVTRQGLAIDSLNDAGYSALAFYLAALHRLDEAAQASHRALELQPESGDAHMGAVTVAIARGDLHAALESAQNMPPNAWRDILVMLSQQAIGNRSVADPALKEFIVKYADVAAYQVADGYALRHEPDKAFEWLDRAWTSRDSGISTLFVDLYLQPYQGDPRFAAFCRKVGLPTPDELAARSRAQQK